MKLSYHKGYVITNKLVTFLIASIVAGTILRAYAQNTSFRFENITSNEGLADRTVYAITQDALGFIWIGSGEGLTRYDGYSCVVYRHESGNPQSLSDNEIYALCTDKEGTLWIGTRNGLNRYDAQNNRFERFFHDSSNDHSIAANEIFALATDPAGNLWIGTYGGGLDKMIKTKNKAGHKRGAYEFVHHTHNTQDSSSISSNQIFSICLGKKGQVWVGTSEGLNVLQTDSKKFTRFYHQQGNENTISNNVVSQVFIDNEGSIWLCGRGMLDKIEGRRSSGHNSAIRHLLPEIEDSRKLNNWVINDFITDKNGNAWMATDNNGLLKFTTGRQGKINAYEQFVSDPQIPHSLVSSTAYCLFEDQSGVVWIGTATGISKYVPAKARFNEANNWHNVFATDKAFITAMLTDTENSLWLAYNSDTVCVLHRDDHSSFARVFSLPRPGHGSDQVNVLFQSKAGDVYIGTFLQGLFIIPASLSAINNKNRWIHVTPDQYPALPSNNIYAVTEDNKGIIWIGTYKGLCSYNPASRQMHAVYASRDGTAMSNYIIRSVCADGQGAVWCGTDNGLYLIKEGRIVKSFKSIENDPASLSNNGVTVVYADHKRNIWIGTKEGLNCYNPLKNNFERVTVQNGLPNDAIRSLQEDATGNLWIGTNHGLVKLDPGKKHVQAYGIVDGLVSDRFVRNAVCRDSAGILYFGTNGGVVSFRPQNISVNSYMPPVAITDIKIFNKSIFSSADTNQINSYRKENKLVLQHHQNFFSFEFAALNYTHSAANQYAYMLEDVDKQWNYIGTQRHAGYTDIAPGRYFFKVKAANNDGIWNPVPEVVEVIITPPWWQTGWFYTVCFMVACAVVYGIYRIRLQQILRLYKLRSSIAKDLHDDVGSALSSIALLSKMAQDGKTTARLKPEEIFLRIGDTSRRMIDLMDDIVWTINPSNDRFSNMLIRMREYAVEMLEARNISFTFNIDERMDELKLPMKIRKDYFLIFKEAVHNIAKYSECGHASIFLERVNHTIVTTIQDDGKGFDTAIRNSGNGLKNMQERAKLVKGSLNVKTEPGKGTCVTLIVPVT